ncbi:M24 family metallopeptidase [Halostagnicola sp. A-GB9-2]|uniref:M24 family metallopeptidase n=1 Tax=Halostagnicola sp. A-GB9-2 TaxID=3048066 RepID=UPI0024BF57A2|nr:M24 family metallopeptidase [Halostagnicola sp. A-GB9-2]MDJ1433644.1 M24 family metallopeptidase [Halostagnicola sp. A-GB9-2]
MSAPASVKHDRIRTELDERALSELWLLRPENVAWFAGGTTVVDEASATGVAALGIPADGSSVRLLAPNNEIDRIRAEELPRLDDSPLDIEPEQYEWHESPLSDAVAERGCSPAGADVRIDGMQTVDPSPLRAPLPSAEIDRYRTACLETTRAVEAVGNEVTAETTEREAATALRRELSTRGFAAPVVLVGGSDRSMRERHFTPTAAPLNEFGHLTVVARRGGHNVAVTRTVAFDLPEWFRERHEATARVAATAIAATAEASRTGGTAGDVFDAIQEAYAETGYANEWRQHHQGGEIGYESREWTATPGSAMPICAPMPFAWNPTIQGTKCEETVLLEAGGNGVDVLTSTDEWPTAKYEAVGFEESVSLHEPLLKD